MIRQTFSAVMVAGVLTGCVGTTAAPQATTPFAGWVPKPSVTLTAYADCLKAHGVPVDDVVGAFILVKRSVEKEMNAATTPCDGKLANYHATVLSNSSRTIPDEDSYRFIHWVRNCMITRFKIDLKAEQTVLILGEPGITQAQFEACVEEIRAYPAPGT